MEKQELQRLNTLKNTFPEESWPWVISALQRTPVIWDQLGSLDHSQHLIKVIGNGPTEWTPGRIAAIQAEREISQHIPWPLSSAEELPAALVDKVHQFYGDSAGEKLAPHGLADAFWQALSLLEEWRSGNDWRDVISAYLSRTSWALPLNVLFSLVSDRVEFLSSLEPDVAFDVLLSHPLPPEQLAELLVDTVGSMDTAGLEPWLKAIQTQVPELAGEIARTLLSSLKLDSGATQDLLVHSLLFQLAGRSEEALKLLEKAADQNQRLQGKLRAHLNKVKTNLDQPLANDRDWQMLKENVGESSAGGESLEDLAIILRSLLGKNQLAAAGELIGKLPDPLPDHPELLYVLAEYARLQNQTIRAGELSVRSLEKTAPDQAPPEGLSSTLLALGLYRESASAAQKYLEKHPNHLPSHLDNLNALRNQGNYTDAAREAQVLSVYYPQDIPLLRKLADCLEEAENWNEALELRTTILNKLQSDKESLPGIDAHLPLQDLAAFANCAYYAKQPNRAISACGQILAQDPDNSQAHAIKGKSLCDLGQVEEGNIHLNRAIELAPDQESSWLSLAEYQQVYLSKEKALQTLKSGLATAASKARILLAIGLIETQNQNHSKALESFQQAVSAAAAEGLDQKTSFEIQLGETLSYYHLGHRDQVQQRLEDLIGRYPGSTRANHLYGKLLLDLDRPQSALPYLVQVIDHNPDDPEPYLHYADALLRSGANPQTAEDILTKALDLDPESNKALVLLGEAQTAGGKLPAALGSFRKAQDSSLNSDPIWSPRISMGLGNTALRMGEIETAIATLKEGQDRYPNDIKLTKSLAEAYQAGNLHSSALEAAKQVSRIAPHDPGNLAWMAAFTRELGCPEEGIAALQKLIQINPAQASAYLNLGKAQAEAGNQKDALEALLSIAQLEDVQPEDLLSSGEILIQMGQIEPGMQCLTKAASICGANPEPSPLMPRIWSSMSRAYQASGNSKKALELLDQAISADLDEPQWRIQKADLLIEEDRSQAAIASLVNALELSPDQPELHSKMARVQRQIAAYEEAFYHSQEALTGYLNDSRRGKEITAPALALAADLACATMRLETANELLSTLDPSQVQSGDQLSNAELHAYCLAGELALDQGQEIRGAEISNLLVSHEVDHPRALALQARLLNRQGNRQGAEEKYREAAESWHQGTASDRTFSVGVELALGRTALELQNWNEASTHLQHAVERAPREKRTLYELGNFYILQAENRRLGEALKAHKRVPGINSTTSDVYQAFQGCLKELESLKGDPALLQGMRARGDAVFSPSQENAEALKAVADTPVELAALIAAFRNCRQLVFAAQTAQSYLDRIGEDPQLDIQVALALLKIKPEQAFKAASSALETARRVFDPQAPLYYLAHALAANQLGDALTAEESLDKALQLWSDEPRWYALAAEISPDYSKSTTYFQQAIELEPEYPGHYLALGRRHMEARQVLPAIKAFEKALSLNPEFIDAWIQRALAKRAMHRLPDALASINQAISLAPDHKEARKTAALLYFESGSYRECEKHLVSLLGQDPNDTDLLALFAKTLTAQKQSAQALRVIEKAISLEQDTLDLELQRASMIKQIDGPSAAVDALRIIGSHHPDRYPLVLELVTTLAEAGEVEQAIRTAQDALINEDLGYSQEQQAHLYLTTGRLLRISGQLDQAVHHLHKAKSLLSPNYQAVLELGRVHYDRRQYDLALEQMQNAINIEPHEAEAYYYAGLVLKDLKQYDRAERMLRKASQLSPNDLKIHRQLGVVVTLNLVHGETRKEVRI
jgi:tetratricopeptide (TPR) repeat protein